MDSEDTKPSRLKPILRFLAVSVPLYLWVGGVIIVEALDSEDSKLIPKIIVFAISLVAYHLRITAYTVTGRSKIIVALLTSVLVAISIALILAITLNLDFSKEREIEKNFQKKLDAAFMVSTALNLHFRYVCKLETPVLVFTQILIAGTAIYFSKIDGNIENEILYAL